MAETKTTYSATYSAETLALLATLGARPIAYHVVFARVWGVKAAILLGQLIYWHGKQADPNGWILKTAGEMEEETALTEREQETARASLIKAGAIEYSRRGLPAMPHYRLIYPKILEGVLAYQDGAKARSLIGQNVLTSEDVCRGVLIGQNVLTNSETTTKITPQITAETTEESGASAPPSAPALASEPPSPSSASLQTVSGTPTNADASAGNYTRSRVITLETPAPDGNQPGATGGTKRGTKRGGKFSPANFTEHEDTRVQIYLEHIKPEITETNAERILSRVSLDYPDQWREAALTHATGNGRGSSYDPDDFKILFDLYEKRVRAKKAEAAFAEMQKQKSERVSARVSTGAVSPIVAMMTGRIERR